MEVVFSMGINLPQKPGPHNAAVPTVSFISRNQTLSWVPDERLKTKGFGIIVATSSYFPDCRSHELVSYAHEADLDLRYIPAAGSTPTPARTRIPDFLTKTMSNVRPLSSLLDYWPRRFELAFSSGGNIDRIEYRGWNARENRWMIPMYPALCSTYSY
ncbi:hypothetical protein C8R47DRAFT_1167863 [Mycena vitilis]|nr:hypothetical protein C8R47DRAFT_1167863 [Mycena vitilis]